MNIRKQQRVPEVQAVAAMTSRRVEQFWAQVQRGADGDACWLWTGACNGSGYGTLCVSGRSVGVHRLSYRLVRGAIPAGKHIDHLCRVRRCVNPAHLDPVTPAENLLRSPITVSATNASKTRCPSGHSYDGSNTGHDKAGSRYCRACKRVRARNARARRRAAPATMASAA